MFATILVYTDFIIKNFSLKYFTKEEYTEELLGKEGYESWVKNYPEFKDVSFDTWKRYWRLIKKEVLEIISTNTFGFELPLYLGTLSLKKMDREFKCEKDFPHTPVYNKELDKMELKPYPNIENKVVKIVWKKSRRNKKIPDLFAVEVKSLLTKQISERIKKGNIDIFQMDNMAWQYPSRCEEVPLKHPFDLV